MSSKGEGGRFKELRRPLDVLSDLMRGKTHDRHSVAKKLGTSPENADRILNLLRDAIPGVEEGHQGRTRQLRFDASKIAPPPEHPVAVAACFGASLASLFEGTTYETGMREAVTYVVRRARRGKQFQHIARKFIFVRQGGEPSLRDRTGEFDELVEGLIHHHRIRFKYKSPTRGESERVVDPLSIAVYDHQLYVIARDDKGQIRPYRFSRTRDLEADEDSAFVYPSQAEYDPHEFFADCFGIYVGLDLRPERIVVRLYGPWAGYARSHRWHRSQRVRVGADHIELELQVPVCPEVETWLLGFGEHVEIVEPVSLREKIAARSNAAAKRLSQR